MDRGKDVFTNDPFGHQNRIFEVVTVPRHERDKHVPTEGQLTKFRGRTVGDDIAGPHVIADLYKRTLIDAGILVRTLELQKVVNVDARYFSRRLFRRPDNDARGVDLIDDTGTPGHDGRARIAGDSFFHARANERRFGLDQRHRLALHVRAHQGAVGIVVFKERNKRRRNRHDLLRRDVHQFDVFRTGYFVFAATPNRDEFIGKLALAVDRGIRLRDAVATFFHRRHIEDLFGYLTLFDLAVRRLDEAILIDARERRQAVDQSDIRAFRRLNRANPAVVRRVHVAHFEAGTFARQTTWSKRREATLMRNLTQRVRLIHELRQLRRPKKFTDRRGCRLGVDQIVRHNTVDIDRAHPLANSALHAKQANTILVLQEFADGANTTIAEVIDIVDLATTVLQFNHDFDDVEDVFLAKNTHLIVGRLIEARVHLHTTDRREIVALGVEEQALEHRFCRLEGRRLTRAHHTIDVDKRVFATFIFVGCKCVADIGADIVVIDRQGRDFRNLRLGEGFEHFLRQLVACFRDDFTGCFVDKVARHVATEELFSRDYNVLEAAFAELTALPRRHFRAGFDHDAPCFRIDQIALDSHTAIRFRIKRNLPTTLVLGVSDGVVEEGQNLFLRHTSGFCRIEHLALCFQLSALRSGLNTVQCEKQRCCR